MGLLTPHNAAAQTPSEVDDPSASQDYQAEDIPTALSEPFQPPLRPFAPQNVPYNLVLFGGAPLARTAKDTAVTQLRFRPLSLVAMMNPELSSWWFLASPFMSFTYETYADPNVRASWLRNPKLDALLQRWPFSRLHSLIEGIKPGDHRPHSYIWGAPDDTRLPLRFAPYIRYQYPDEAIATTPHKKTEIGVKKGLRSGLYQEYGEWAYENGEWKLTQIKMQKSTASAQFGDSWLKQRKVSPDLFTRAMGVSAREYFTWRYLSRNFLLFWMRPADTGRPKLSKDEAHALLIAESEDLALVERFHGEVAQKLDAAKQAGHAGDIAFYQERLNIYARAREQIRTHLATFIEFNDPHGTMQRFAEQTRRLIYHTGLDDLEEGFRHAARTATEMFQVANFFNMVFDLSALRKDPNQSLLYHIYDAAVLDDRTAMQIDRRRLRDRHIANRLFDAASPLFIGFFGAALADATTVAFRKYFEKTVEKHFWFEGIIHIWALWAATYYFSLFIEEYFKHQNPDVLFKLLTLNGQLAIAPIAAALYAAMAFEAAFFGIRGLLSVPNLFNNFGRHPIPGLIAIASVVYMAWGLS